MTLIPPPCCIAAAPFATAPQQLLPAIPYLVGYHPSDSLVALFLRDDGSVPVTARLDWDACRADPISAATAIVEPAQRSEPTRVLLAAVDPVHPDSEALAAAADVCVDSGLSVIWAGERVGDTWRGLDCAATGCDVHVLDDDAPPAVVTQLVSQGHAPLADRHALTDQVAPDRTPPADRPVAVERPHGVGIEAWRDELLRSCADILVRTEPLSSSEVAVMAAGCRDIRVRDVLLWRLTVGVDNVLVGWEQAWVVISEVLRRCSAEDAAPVGAVGAVVAWQLGDGIRATACLDRAWASDPSHSLAGLVRRSVGAGCPPSMWHQVMAGLTESDCRYGARS